jgi:hypothetical protein
VYRARRVGVYCAGVKVQAGSSRFRVTASRDGLMICHAPSGFRVSDLAGKAVHFRCRMMSEPDITKIHLMKR